MAIVKCANRSGSTVKGLVSYVMDDAKMKCMDVYGLDCADTSKESIIRQMNETKQTFGKVGGREVYHLIISFHKNEVITPEKANQLAILRDWNDVLNVFIHGDIPEKMQRIMGLYNVEEKEAVKMMADIDKRRMTNYNFYTDQKWGKASNYTLCLNSSQLGYDRCEAIIMECAK